MKIEALTPDDLIMLELGDRLAQVRIARGLTQAALAGRAGVSKRTLERLEAGQVGTHFSVFIRIFRALELLENFEALLPASEPGPMARLELAKKKRQRASTRKAPPKTLKKWKWGEPS
ncbi:helix-turn-helix domain-containing protein [soil metagenome]